MEHKIVIIINLFKFLLIFLYFIDVVILCITWDCTHYSNLLFDQVFYLVSTPTFYKQLTKTTIVPLFSSYEWSNFFTELGSLCTKNMTCLLLWLECLTFIRTRFLNSHFGLLKRKFGRQWSFIIFMCSY